MHADNHVARADFLAVDDLSALDHAHAEAREIILALHVHAQEFVWRIVRYVGIDGVHIGEEALVLYRRYLNVGRPYDLVILDLTVIGGMGGEETFRELRALDPNVRAIVCSGYDSEEMAEHYAEMGLCGYLAKPFRVADLGKILKTVLG